MLLKKVDDLDPDFRRDDGTIRKKLMERHPEGEAPKMNLFPCINLMAMVLKGTGIDGFPEIKL